ncbi:MAG: Methyltransferase type 11 [Streptosporangiaceae bacterium]|nr:Methyltransferase type 11 [Streptosporangiaceae bacterium]
MTDPDPRFSAAFWDQRYSSTDQVWSGTPNPALVDEVSSLAPGTAVDVGCGEGADAIWLAGQGWQVTGVDFSTRALDQAAEHTPLHLARRLAWQHADIRDWQLGDEDGYDLVTASFNHFPLPVRRAVFAALAARVAPQGHLVIVGHHPSDLDTAMPRPSQPGLFYTADDLADDLPDGDWKVLTRAARPRAATTPDGASVTIHDTVFTAQRTR